MSNEVDTNTQEATQMRGHGKGKKVKGGPRSIHGVAKAHKARGGKKTKERGWKR